ncbi:pep a2 [Streptomyces sp. NPDC048290]|uniref:pep a2 n=1 Tax=Streptomyces sp. NPDC048290 TaxID=3155811 RepID=UPI00342E06A7
MKTAVPCYYHLDVDITPERVGQVQRILAAHLRHWDLDPLVAPVCGNTGLLLAAIAAHATGTSTTVELWWNGQHLITAVGEHDDTLRPDQELRGCLERIAAMSDGWGCCATGTGSKVIWFSQRARDGERLPLVPTAPGPRLRAVRQVPRSARPATALAAPAPGRGRTPEGAR